VLCDLPLLAAVWLTWRTHFVDSNRYGPPRLFEPVRSGSPRLEPRIRISRCVRWCALRISYARAETGALIPETAKPGLRLYRAQTGFRYPALVLPNASKSPLPSGPGANLTPYPDAETGQVSATDGAFLPFPRIDCSMVQAGFPTGPNSFFTVTFASYRQQMVIAIGCTPGISPKPCIRMGLKSGPNRAFACNWANPARRAHNAWPARRELAPEELAGAIDHPGAPS
jgi:hypothetical protein